MCDVGMCGDYESVLGMDREEPLNRFLSKIPRGRFEPAQGPGTLSALAVEIDDATGLAVRTKAVRLGGALAPTEPLFWVE
jgi:calcineurin-like phosphoesterase